MNMTNAHGAWDALVGLEQMEVDTGPAAADFVVGDTVTGSSSGKTCVIVAVISSTNYLIKDRDGEFTDGEILTDESTNSVDCAAGYPVITNENVLGLLADDTALPKAVREQLDAILAKVIAGGTSRLTRADMAEIGAALVHVGAKGGQYLTQA
jgi:hypothetical protein